jgi:hypothetical protein
MTRRLPDSAGIALALAVAGLSLCAAKWAGVPWLADVGWREAGLLPACALAAEAVILFVWFFVMGKEPKP